jgi:hypothetical protein
MPLARFSSSSNKDASSSSTYAIAACIAPAATGKAQIRVKIIRTRGVVFFGVIGLELVIIYPL